MVSRVLRFEVFCCRLVHCRLCRSPGKPDECRHPRFCVKKPALSYESSCFTLQWQRRTAAVSISVSVPAKAGNGNSTKTVMMTVNSNSTDSNTNSNNHNSHSSHNKKNSKIDDDNHNNEKFTTIKILVARPYTRPPPPQP